MKVAKKLIASIPASDFTVLCITGNDTEDA